MSQNYHRLNKTSITIYAEIGVIPLIDRDESILLQVDKISIFPFPIPIE